MTPGVALGVAPGVGLRAREAAEGQRLLSLQRSGLLEAGDEERFDRIVRRARRTFGVRIAALSYITAHQQILRAVVGLSIRSTDRETAFCNTTIQGEDLLIVPDALRDPRFSTNPLVLGEPSIRFYAGCPLRGPGGYFIGSLCVIDQKPRTFTKADQQALRKLADEAELELNTPGS